MKSILRLLRINGNEKFTPFDINWNKYIDDTAKDLHSGIIHVDFIFPKYTLWTTAGNTIIRSSLRLSRQRKKPTYMSIYVYRSKGRYWFCK